MICYAEQPQETIDKSNGSNRNDHRMGAGGWNRKDAEAFAKKICSAS